MKITVTNLVCVYLLFRPPFNWTFFFSRHQHICYNLQLWHAQICLSEDFPSCSNLEDARSLKQVFKRVRVRVWLVLTQPLTLMVRLE